MRKKMPLMTGISMNFVLLNFLIIERYEVGLENRNEGYTIKNYNINSNSKWSHLKRIWKHLTNYPGFPQICVHFCSSRLIITAATEEMGWHFPLSYCGLILFPHWKSPKKTRENRVQDEIHKESKWIKFKHNRAKQTTLILSFLF